MKPVRSLDSLRSAWTGRLRHGSPPSVPSNETLPNKNFQSVSLSLKSPSNIVSKVERTEDSYDNQIKKFNNQNSTIFFTKQKPSQTVATGSIDKKNNDLIKLTNPFINFDERLSQSKGLDLDNPFANGMIGKEYDPFDTSQIHTRLNSSFSDPITHNPLKKNYSLSTNELSSCSAHLKVNTII